jgi:phosphomannomutase / phosphoglucomutase
MLSPHIFRAYDIRGIYGEDFDEDGAYLIAKGYASYLHKTYPHRESFRVSIGRDGRDSGASLEEAFREGLLESGIDIVKIGQVSSPMLYYSVCAGGYDGGVMITASHNPSEYNGFKLQTIGAKAICDTELKKILSYIEAKDFFSFPEKGTTESQDIREEYFSLIKEIVSFPESIKGKKISIDAGNGIMGAYAPDFFRSVGFEVYEIFCEVDGRFPNHVPDPEREENLQDLKQYIKKHQCDLGIAFDGDGDRVGVVDREGNHYSADLLLLLLSRDVLSRNPGASIVYDLKSTERLAEDIRARGGVPVMCKTGHSFVEQKMEETEALLGGEVSGHLFFAEDYFGFDDALLAAAKIIKIVFTSEKSLSQIFAELPQTYITPEIKVSVSEEEKFRVVGMLSKNLLERYPNAITIDGIRIDFSDGAWGILRASNTSAYITTRFEARTKEKLLEIQNIIFREMRKFSEISGIPDLKE